MILFGTFLQALPLRCDWLASQVGQSQKRSFRWSRELGDVFKALGLVELGQVEGRIGTIGDVVSYWKMRKMHCRFMLFF